MMGISPGTVQAQTYLWPTDSGQYLSSTFGETRSQHFHAGLDIKTWGQEGYRVFASRSGHLYRLLVTERGYGNAIYLKHDDGSYTVYAHLQRFAPELQAIADSIRLQDYSFEMDATFDSTVATFEQGDLIGYTGSSGIGPPHLHFEVRDSLQNPVNALTTNLTVKDELSPVFSSLIAEPLNSESRINSQPISHYATPVKRPNGVYDFGTIRLHGSTGLAVNVYDRANDVYNVYAIYSLALLHKKDTLFYQELKQFSYDESGEMYIDRIAPFGSTRRGHQRLYAKEGGEHPFHLKVTDRSRISASDSTDTYTIIAADYFGNTSKAKITIKPNSSSTTSSPVDLSRPISDWYWHQDWVSPDLMNTINLKRTSAGWPWTDDQRLLFRDDTNSVPILLARVYPESSKKLTLPDRRLQLRFPRSAFFDTLSVAATYTIEDEKAHISVQPQMLAAKSEFGIAFYLGDLAKPGENYRLFRKRPSGSLSYVDSRLIGRTVWGFPSQLGEFVIQADNEAPEVSSFKIYKTDYGEWRARVRVSDEKTGINSSSARFIINGQRGIAEYDYEEEVLIYYLPDFTPSNTNTAEIYIEDPAGNATRIHFKE